MAREVCSDPFGLGEHPREADSPSISYCRSCSRRKQRERYKAEREAAGIAVVPRNVDPDARRVFLRDGARKPGVCEACLETEPEALVLVCTIPEGRTREWCLEWMEGNLWSLWCQKCTELAKQLSPEEWLRFRKLLTYIVRTGVLPDQLLLP